MEQSSEDVKTRILQSAQKLFAEQGFDVTSVRQICDEAGANVSLISYYFGGKENVFYALFEYYFPTNALAEYESVLEDPIVGLKLIIQEVIRYRMENPEMSKIFQREILLSSPRSEIIKTYIFPIWKKLREVLEKGRKKGVFHYRSLDNAMMFVLGTLIFPRGHSFLNPLLSEGEPNFTEVVEDTTQFVFGGLTNAKMIK